MLKFKFKNTVFTDSGNGALLKSTRRWKSINYGWSL